MDVEKCAIGVFHKALGDAMEIPFHRLPSYNTGWRDEMHFVNEIPIGHWNMNGIL